MRRGLRHLPVKPRGRRRLGLLGVGVLAALTLVWQQQATLASYTDVEFGTATFTAATLEAITPTTTAKAGSIDIAWAAATGDWATPQYSLDWSESASGTSPTDLYGGTATGATHNIGSATPSDYGLTFTAVAVGATHACGVANGTVYCWGTSTRGALGLGSTTVAHVPTAVTGGDLGSRTVTDVTAGTDFSCAVASGKAYCWGLGTNGQLGNGSQSSSTTPKAVSNLTGITSISAGGAHACAVARGVAYCWGKGTNGQIGDGGTSQKESPTAVRTDGVLSGRTVSRISAGGAHSCVVADAAVYCWGLNTNGQLGDATNTQRTTPVAVDVSGLLMGRSVSAVSAGASHTCAIADREAFCWGLGTSGQLGNSANTSRTTPVAVATAVMSDTVTAISGGALQTCAVAGGNAYCWGTGQNHGLGDAVITSSNVPVTAIGSLDGRKVTAISAGSDTGCAVAKNAPAACWGWGSNYVMGDDSPSNNKVPFDVTLTGPACPDGSVRRSDTTCSLLQGTDYYYRLGYSIGTWAAPDSDWVKQTTKTRAALTPSAAGRTSSSITVGWDTAPEPGQAYPEYTLQRSTSSDGSNAATLTVTGETSFTDAGGVAPTRSFSAVTAGDSHTCGIIGTDVYCWGQNSNGQLGVGDSNPRTVPTKVAALDNKTVTAVSAGSNHTCAIADGKVYCWGQGTSGQLGNGTNNTAYSPVLVSNQGGLTVTAVSAGTSHTCAIANDAAYCWGSNSHGQLGNDSTTNANTPVAVSTSGDMGGQTVTAIAAGGQHTCAVAADNRAYCWGYDADGQLGSQYTYTYRCWLFFTCTGTDMRDRTTPAAVDTGGAMGTRNVHSISAGSSHTCAVASGAAYCWGLGTSGQLGNSSTGSTYLSRAVTTSTMSATVSAISAGANSACAIAGGAAYCWGAGTAGQLGNAASNNRSAPAAVAENGAMKDGTVTSIASGTSHGCAVSDGLAYCWGSGDNGRLGNRTTTSYNYPVLATTDALCGASTPLGDGTCSLKGGTTYYYRVSYTLDGTTKTTGDWTGIKTN